MTVTPEIVHGDEWLDRIARFRVEVWTLSDMIAPDAFPDGRCLEAVDRDATQIVVAEEGRLLGATRYAQFPDLDSTHLGTYYREAGIDLEGPIGVPERMVVHPDVARQGVAWTLAAAIQKQALSQGARNLIIECSPGTAALMRKRGRASLGLAPPDDRFPDVRFEWIHSDMSIVAREVAGGFAPGDPRARQP